MKMTQEAWAGIKGLFVIIYGVVMFFCLMTSVNPEIFPAGITIVTIQFIGVGIYGVWRYRHTWMLDAFSSMGYFGSWLIIITFIILLFVEL